VFLVGSIAFAAGYSSGTPGPHAVYGSAASGIVVERMGDAAQTGLVIAHELGHFLGLQHTTRLTQDETGYQILGDDGIGDTPVCPAHSNTKDCPDYRNLMFPIFPLDGLALSAGQAVIAGRIPILYEVNLPATCAYEPAVIDLTLAARGTGNTEALQDRTRGSCGGLGAPERVHVFHLAEPATALDFTVHGFGFAPAVYVRRGTCAPGADELACLSGEADQDAAVSIPFPTVGDYFIIVDGKDGAVGRFSIEVWLRFYAGSRGW